MKRLSIIVLLFIATGSASTLRCKGLDTEDVPTAVQTNPDASVHVELRTGHVITKQELMRVLQILQGMVGLPHVMAELGSYCDYSKTEGTMGLSCLRCCQSYGLDFESSKCFLIAAMVDACLVRDGGTYRVVDPFQVSGPASPARVEITQGPLSGPPESF